MRSVSVYTITRNQNIKQLQKMEQHLSGREYLLNIREWELSSMKELVNHLEKHMSEVYKLRLFYSFQIPRLGKEFDLLQITDEQIVNIELKSGAVSEEAIRKQLIQNRYYLTALGRQIRSYTYISSQNRLVRLTNHDRIVDADWGELCADLQKDGNDYEGNIEDLFQAELYLISPLAEPDRFLRKEYFLTSQQRDIERQILRKIKIKEGQYFWFSGLPGTGKTLLLYDIAMKLSNRQSVCMIHCGENGKKWELLHERLRRIVFLPDNQIEKEMDFSTYHAVLIDEAHLLSPDKLKILLEQNMEYPMIFSSDCEDMIAPEELGENAVRILKNLPEVQTFRLTNRIRTNAELSSFIQSMIHLPRNKCHRSYSHIEVVYANNKKEAENLLQGYDMQGYQRRLTCSEIKSMAVRDAERLAVVLDERYYYDEKGYLRSERVGEQEMSDVRRLFHVLNQAKERLVLVVVRNEKVYEVLLELV